MKYTLSMRLYGGFGALLLVTALMGIAGFVILSQTSTLTTKTIKGNIEINNISTKMLKKQREIFRAARDFYEKKDPAAIDRVRTLVSEFKGLGRDAISLVEKQTGDSKKAEVFRELITMIDSGYLAGFMKITEMVLVEKAGKDRVEEAKDRMRTTVTLPMGDKIYTVIDQSRDEAEKDIKALLSDLFLLKLLIVFIAFAGIIAGTVLSVVITRSINRTILEISRNLNTRADHVADSSKKMIDESATLAQNAQEQAASVVQISSSMEEMSAQVQGNAETALHVVGQVVRSVEIAENSAEIAISAAKLSETARASAENGAREIENIVLSMDEIISASEQITNIIDAINDITQQTKMLAVNAAIEAARAGEHGKGFAVVADQVSKLAETSRESAKEIAVLIKESAKKTEMGSRIAIKGTESIKDILTNSVRVSDMIADLSGASRTVAEELKNVKTDVEGMAKATHEQASGIEQVTHAIHLIDQSIQGNSVSSVQVSDAAEELNKEAENLLDIVGTLNLFIAGIIDRHGDNEESLHSGVRRVQAMKPGELLRRVRKETGRHSDRKPSEVIPMRNDFSDFNDNA